MPDRVFLRNSAAENGEKRKQLQVRLNKKTIPVSRNGFLGLG
jgi:hypothetical protein